MDKRTSWRRDLFYHRDGDGAVLGKSKSNDFGVLSLLLSLSLMRMLMHQQTASLMLTLLLMLMLMRMRQQKHH